MKVLLLGIDGGTWTLIEDFKENMKFIPEVVGEGSTGTLRSTIPPVTLPAWPSMFTGYNPAQHGIPSFLDKKLRPMNFLDLKKPPIWEVLSSKGIPSLIFNVPATYPPKPLLGVLVSGLGAEEGGKYAFPEEVMEELSSRGYFVEPDLETVRSLDSSRRAKERLLKFEKKHFEEFCRLDSGDFSFYFYVFRITDIAQHIVWKDKSYLAKVYSLVDSLSEKIYERISPDLLIICSDHGFSDYYEAFSIKAFLRSLGMLEEREKEGKGFLSKLVKALNLSPEKIPRPLLSFLRRITPAKIREGVSPAKETDPERSLAYGEWFHYGICINEERAGNYEELRNYLIRELLSLRDRQGRKIFKWVLPREKVYQGPYLDRLPDILFEPEDWIFPAGSKWAKEPIEEYYSWQHHVNGIFIAYGGEVSKGNKIMAEIWDIAPTILHAFSLSIPEDMEGRPRLEIFKRGSELAKGVKTIKAERYLAEKRAILRALKKIKGGIGENKDIVNKQRKDL